MASLRLAKVKRRPNDGERLLIARTLLEDVHHAHVVDHAAVVDLARESTLTTYDACYLWLARTVGAKLVTFDQRLGRASAGR